MRFAVFTHVIHQKHLGNYYAYSPYVREMNLWLKYAETVKIVAPATRALPNPKLGPNVESKMGMCYLHSNLIFTTIPNFHLLSLGSAIKSIFIIPIIFFRILGAMRRADHLHLRCPGNIGLLACTAQIFFPGKSKTAKYAGNWDPNAKQPWSYKLQKWILSNTFLTRNMKVLVYGNWPDQSKNILPFFTASFSETEKILVNKDFTSPFKFIFVGSLSPGKRPLFAIQLIENLMGKGIPVKLEIYGSGVLKNELEEYIATKNLDPFVKLMGNFKLEELEDVYKASHFLILASQSEGWPKAVAEAMFFGCIPLVTPVSCVPWMLAPPARSGTGGPEGGAKSPPTPKGGDNVVTITGRGILIPDFEKGEEIKMHNGNKRVESQDLLNETVEKILELIKDPEKMKQMSLAGQEWSQEYTLEKFEAAIKKVLAPRAPKGEQKKVEKEIGN